MVAKSCQMYLSTYNATFFQCSATVTGQCRFNFPFSTNKQTKIIVQSNIEVLKNNV